MNGIIAENPTASDLHEAANLAIEQGFAVIKLTPGSKVPAAGTRGLKDATRDAEEVARWYADGTAWNYGIATEGLFVVDPDVDDANPINQWYRQHAERLMDCPVVRTPRGGSHLYYRQPDGAGLRNSTSTIADKVDTRADGGYAVGPGSVVGGKAYACLPDRGLEPVESLPVAPDWLLEQAKRDKPNVVTKATAQAGTIPEGQRDDTLARIAGTMRRAGMMATSIEAGLQADNVARCNPPLPAEDVSRIAHSVARYEPAEVPQVPSEPVEFDRITCGELANGDYAVEYLINGTMAAGQPLIIAGPQKSLKTSFIIDAAISLATATPMLGQLEVPHAVRVAVMTGESGLATIQETARRIAVSKVEDLGSIENLIWSPDLPRFGSSEHKTALKQFLTDDGIEVLFIDPAYLCMPGSDAGNLMAQGELLRPMAKACEEVGVTMVLAHHAKKNRMGAEGSPLELSDIAWAGFAEFARQWWLVSRRERYVEGSGQHDLWLSVGGSAGHSALWGVDVTEGVYSPHEPRRWDVTVQPGYDLQQEQRTKASEAKERRREFDLATRLEADKVKILGAMIRLATEETQTQIAGGAGISNARALQCLLSLQDDGSVASVKLKKNGRELDGWKLTNAEEDAA